MAELHEQMDNVVRENRELKEKWIEIEDIMMSANIVNNESKADIQNGRDSEPVHQSPPVTNSLKILGMRILFDHSRE